LSFIRKLLYIVKVTGIQSKSDGGVRSGIGTIFIAIRRGW
jgi:hypothetical protein